MLYINIILIININNSLLNVKSLFCCLQIVYFIVFTDIPTAGIYKDLDKLTAYSLIHPNIFTKHGLSYTDLSKVNLNIYLYNILKFKFYNINICIVN